jgi:hypothetical protein
MLERLSRPFDHADANVGIRVCAVAIDRAPHENELLPAEWERMRQGFINDPRTIEALEAYTGRSWVRTRRRDTVSSYAVQTWDDLHLLPGMGGRKARDRLEMLAAAAKRSRRKRSPIRVASKNTAARLQVSCLIHPSGTPCGLDRQGSLPEFAEQFQLLGKGQCGELRTVGAFAFDEAFDPVAHGSSGVRKRFPKCSHLSSRR